MKIHKERKALKDKSSKYNYTMDEKNNRAENLAIKLGMRRETHISGRPHLFNNRFCVSQMINKEKKMVYYFHEDIEVIKTFINKLPNHNLFEIIHTDYPKVYFDIDKIDVKYNLDDEAFNRMVEDLTANFNKEFNTSIKMGEVIKLIKRNESGLIKSTHIIFSATAIDKKILKWWVKKINKSNMLDENVYKSNNALCLKNNCKFGGLEVFKDMDDRHTDILDTLTSYGLDDEFTIIDHKPYTDSIINTSKKINLIKSLTKKDKNIIKVNGSNFVEELLNNLEKDNKFYKSKFWCGLVGTMKYLKVNEMEEFLNKSVERAYKPNHYSKEDNKKWYNNLNQDDIEYKNIRNQINKLNIDYGLRFVWVGNSFYDTEELREWVFNNINGVSREMIDTKFIKINKKCYDKPTKITFNKTTYLDLSKMYLINGDNPIKCYWNDYHNKRVNTEHDNNFKLLDIDDLVKRQQDFINNNKKVFGLKMAWGMGKSHYIMKPFVLGRFKLNDRILILTENNSLNKDVYNDLLNLLNDEGEEAELVLWSHMDRQPITEDHKIFICSMESLFKLTRRKPTPIEFNTIILDETETIISHLESETLGEKYDSGEVLTDMREVIINSNKVMCLDADLSLSRFNLLTQSCNIENGLIDLYENTNNKWRTHKININVGNRYGTLSKIVECVKNGDNIAIATMSKREAESIFKLLSSKFNDKNILGVWRGIKKYRIGGNEERFLTTDEAKSSMNEIIDNEKINIWIYSPSVLTGISYNKKDWFNKTFLLTSPTSCCARLGIQMLFRVRHLKDEEINICLTTLKPPIEDPSKDDIIELIKQKKIVSLANSIKLLFRDECEIKQLYKDFKVENLKELYLSTSKLGGDLGQEILKILTANHRIPLNFITITKNQYDNMITKEEMSEVKEEVKQNTIERLINAEYKNEKEIEKQEKKNYVDCFNYKSIEEVEKKKLLKLLGIRNSYYIKYGEQVEYMDKIGVEYEGVGNNEILDCIEDMLKIIVDGYDGVYTPPLNYKKPSDSIIKSSPLSYENFIHDSKEIYEGLLNLDKTSNINNINDFNESIIKDPEATNILDKRDEMKIYNNNLKFVIKKIFPQLFNGDYLAVKNFNIKVSDFNKILSDNEKDINEFWTKLIEIDKVKKRNTRLKKENTNKIIYYLKHLLNLIGLDIIAPKNKKRDNEEYKIIYDKKYIYNNQVSKPIDKDIRIIDNKLSMNGKNIDTKDKRNKPIKEIVSKNLTIKPSVKKLIDYTSKDKLVIHKNIKWNNEEKTEEIIYKSPSIKRVKINNNNNDDFSIILKNQSLFKNQYAKHFIRMRPKKMIDNNLKEIYDKNRPPPNKEMKRCLIEDDIDIDEDDLIIMNTGISALDRGVED